MKILTRLVLGFGVLTLLVVMIAGVSIVKSGALGGAIDSMVNDSYVKVTRLNKIKDELNQIARSQRAIVIMDKPDEIDEQFGKIDLAHQQIADQWAVLKPMIRFAKGKELLAKAEAAGSEFETLKIRFESLISSGNVDGAKVLLLGDLRLIQLAYFGALDELIAFQEELMDAAAAEASSDFAQMKVILWTSGGVALLIAVLLGVWTSRAIIRPISQAVEISRAVADGDLNMQFDAAGKSETAQLLQALKAMQESLAKVVFNVRQNAESVAAASAQIAQSNADLSQRTEEQAAALVETAASMEEQTSTVRQNADNAQQATTLAVTASGIAQQGGEVVGRVVQTMHGISGSSARVAEIISVIESISFQTNILALNAAVEAARAGEQGRGFAVVAGEIRALAQRSTTAAKEIKELISESVARVDAGSKLVDEAGSTMNEIVQAVKRVTDIIGEIAAASEEQSSGIEQVNAAVIQMDQMTQQNAAMVEEASAAAQSLVQQAEDLRTAVATFKLGGNESGGAAYRMAATQIKPAQAKTMSAAHRTPRSESKSVASASEWEAF